MTASGKGSSAAVIEVMSQKPKYDSLPKVPILSATGEGRFFSKARNLAHQCLIRLCVSLNEKLETRRQLDILFALVRNRWSLAGTEMPPATLYPENTRGDEGKEESHKQSTEEAQTRAKAKGKRNRKQLRGEESKKRGQTWVSAKGKHASVQA